MLVGRRPFGIPKCHYLLVAKRNDVLYSTYVYVSGQRLLQKSCGHDTGQGGGGGGGGGGGVSVGVGNGGGGRGEPESPSNTNADTNDTKNLVLQNLEAVHSSQQHLLQLWHHKKLKLDQCFQLRLFEQDCEKVRLAVKFI